MGRGRQKAKHTKVARELKYHSSSIDVAALQQELSGEPDVPPVEAAPADDSADDDPYGNPYRDPYGDVYGGYAADDEDDGPAGRYASARR